MYDLRSRVRKFLVTAREDGLGAALGKTAAYVRRSCGYAALHESATGGTGGRSPRQRATAFKETDTIIEQEKLTTNKTIRKWNKSDEVYCVDGFKGYWECLDEVARYQHQMMTEGKDLIECVASFFPQGKRLEDLNALVVGCTHGEVAPPVAMARTGAFKRILVVDIAGVLLRRQEQITNSLGLSHVIEYQRMDLNVDSIREESTLDVIFSLGTIHHIERLEGLFPEINKALRKDGLFCMREYIGPSHLQFTEKQIHLCNEMLEALPDYLRREQNGKIKSKGWRPTRAEIEADDPSEAVRSHEILGIAHAFLDVVVCRMTGGTILDPLLHGIAGNFEKGEAERAVLRDLIVAEQRLIEQGVIPSDYVFVIARKKW